MDAAGQPVALFDWDGTLASGVSALKFMLYLAEQPQDPAAPPDAPLVGCYSRLALRHMSALISLHQRGELSHAQMVDRGSRTYCFGLRGQPVARIADLADGYVESHGADLHFFTHETLDTLADAGVTNVVISGAPAELLRAWARRLPLHAVHGLSTEQGADGRYTGRMTLNTAIPIVKAELATAYAQHPVVLAAGDTESDLPLLDLARYRITVGTKLNLPPGPRHLNIRSDDDPVARARISGFLSRALGSLEGSRLEGTA